MKRVGFWCITIAAILGAFWTYDAQSIPPEYAALSSSDNLLSSPEAISSGAALYRANCTSCHGMPGSGQGLIQPSFGPQPADLTGRLRMGKWPPQYLYWRVSEGGMVEPFWSQGSIMPAWKYRLDAGQRWELIAYIRTLSR